MKKFILLCLFLSATIVCGQGDGSFVYRPIPGYTETPFPGSFTMKTAYANIKATSLYDEKGDEITMNKLVEGDADPEVFFSEIDLRTEYAINERLTAAITFPMIMDQGIQFDNVNPDMSGETGLGDIRISGYAIASESKTYRFMGFVSLKLATGSDPYDIDDDAFSSTGTGQTDIDFGLLGDFSLADNMLLSLGGWYSLRNEGAYSSEGDSWDEKPGNEISAKGTFSVQPSTQLGLGIGFDFFSAAKDEFEGDEIDDSESNGFSLSPTVGYKISSGNTNIHLLGEYYLNVSGKNIYKMGGFVISAYLYI